VCHAERAPALKVTLDARNREGSGSSETVSIHTRPVNQAVGPMEVAVLVASVMFMACPRMDGDLKW
jgi:hypothetical protein